MSKQASKQASKQPCAHPLAGLTVEEHWVLNCPAEGEPDEESVAVFCRCGERVATGVVAVCQFLLCLAQARSKA